MIPSAEMNALRLKWQRLDEQEQTNLPLALGTYDPNRQPVLSLKTFTGPMTLRPAVSPDCGFRLLKEAFEAAKATLDIYIYNISAGHILKLLKTAAGTLTVRLMYDANDDGVREWEELEKIVNASAGRLTVRKAPSARPRSAFTVCHQKLIVADGQEVFMGSANFAGTSFPEVTEPNVFKKGNREWVVRILNTEVAQWYATLFEEDWNIPSDLPGPDSLVLPESSPALPLEPLGVVTKPEVIADIEPQEGDMKVTPVVSPDNYFDEVLRAIQESETEILVQQQDIKAKFRQDAKVDQLLMALEERKNAGVTVRILTSPAYPSGWEKTVDSLHAYGLDDCLRAISLKVFKHLHNKGLVFDRNKVLVTSTNWTENSINYAREAGVLICHGGTAEYYARSFDQDWDFLSLPPEDVAHGAPAALAAGGPLEEADANQMPDLPV